MPKRARDHHYLTVPGGYRAARKAAGLLQRDVARELGVSNSYISHIEGGRFAFPDVDLFMEMCDLYGVEPWDLFDRCYMEVD